MATIPEIARFIGNLLEDRVDDAQNNVKIVDLLGKSVITLYIGAHRYAITIEADTNVRN